MLRNCARTYETEMKRGSELDPLAQLENREWSLRTTGRNMLMV